MGKFAVPFCKLFINLWLCQSHCLTFKMFTSRSSSIYANHKIPNENPPAGKVGYKMDLLFSVVQQTRHLPNILVVWEILQFHLVNCSSNYDFTKVTIWLFKCLLVLFGGSQPPSIQTIRFLMRTHWPAKPPVKMDLLFSLVRQTRRLPNILVVWENLQIHFVNCI